jgi:hypothetical protein
MPFYQHPSAPAVHPVMRNPHSALARRPIIVARHPHIAIAVPAMIAAYPHISVLWRAPTMLINFMRWPLMYIHLRKRCRRYHGECKKNCKCNLFHDD